MTYWGTLGAMMANPVALLDSRSRRLLASLRRQVHHPVRQLVVDDQVIALGFSSAVIEELFDRDGRVMTERNFLVVQREPGPISIDHVFFLTCDSRPHRSGRPMGPRRLVERFSCCLGSLLRHVRPHLSARRITARFFRDEPHPSATGEDAGLRVTDRGLQFRIVAQQYVFHRGVIDPVVADLGVHLGPQIVGEEAVALQSARCHQHEDPVSRYRKNRCP